MAAFDYGYDVGSFKNRNLQVTRYRQNIQRYRDYGDVGDVSAPVAEGRIKQGIAPGGYQFQPPSAGVSAQFNRGEAIRNPNQPSMDIRGLHNLLTNRLFYDYELESRQGGPSQTGDNVGTFQAQPRSSRRASRRGQMTSQGPDLPWSATPLNNVPPAPGTEVKPLASPTPLEPLDVSMRKGLERQVKRAQWSNPQQQLRQQAFSQTGMPRMRTPAPAPTQVYGKRGEKAKPVKRELSEKQKQAAGTTRRSQMQTPQAGGYLD